MKYLPKILIWICILSPIIFFYYVFDIYSFNFPFEDDFYNITNPLIQFESSSNWFDKISSLFYTKREHINFTTKLIALIELSIFGDLNFKTLTLTGNLILIPIALFFYAQIPINKNKSFHFIPIVLIIFCGSYWLISIQGLTTTQHFGTLLLALLSFKMLQKDKFIISFLLATWATFTFGNGIIVLLILSVSLLIRKDYKHFLYIGFGTAIIVIIYAYKIFPLYENPETNIPILVKIRFTINIFATYLGYNFLYTTFFVAIISVTLAIGLLWKNKKFKNNEFYISMFLFILISVCLIGFRRSWIGISHSFMSRYTLYSLLLLILIYLLMIEQKIITPKNLWIAIVFALFVNLNSWNYGIKKLNSMVNGLHYDFYTWNNNCELIKYEKEKKRCHYYLEFIEKGHHIPPKNLSNKRFIKW